MSDDLITPYTPPASPVDAAPTLLRPGVPTPLTRPRVWTVFVALLLALVVSQVLQLPIVLILLLAQASGGTPMQEVVRDLPKTILQPGPFLAILLVTQLAFGLAAIIPAKLSSQLTHWRLGLVNPGLPAWSFPVIAIGAICPLAVGIRLAVALAQVLKPGETVAQMYTQMTPGAAIPFIVCIALFPGFMEELLFRGYMQRRLLERWSPAAALTITAVLFSLVHFMPHAIVAVVPLAVWFGLLAWRTGSVWPGIVCHAFVNGAWNVWQLGNLFGYIPEPARKPAAIAIVALSVVCFALSAWLVFRPARVSAASVLGSTS